MNCPGGDVDLLTDLRTAGGPGGALVEVLGGPVIDVLGGHRLEMLGGPVMDVLGGPGGPGTWNRCCILGKEDWGPGGPGGGLFVSFTSVNVQIFSVPTVLFSLLAGRRSFNFRRFIASFCKLIIFGLF